MRLQRGIDWPVVIILGGALLLGACTAKQDDTHGKKQSPFSVVEICFQSVKNDTPVRVADSKCEEAEAGVRWGYTFEQESSTAELPAIGEHVKGTVRVQFTLPKDVTIGRVPDEGALFDGKIS